jgi:hypothetical protein
VDAPTSDARNIPRLNIEQTGGRQDAQLVPCHRICGIRDGGRVDEQRHGDAEFADERQHVREHRAMAIVGGDHD